MLNPIHNRVDTIFVHVTNLERSIRWYSVLLGLEVREGGYIGPVYTLDMGLGRPGITLDNHCFDLNYELIPSNQPLFNLSTSDINAAYHRVKELEADIVTEIQTYPDLSDFTFKDPDGNMIMVCTCFS
ncbi:VOC family protein [Paenibacillus eucommiae]|uniref:Enzyme related to lactoylglutathione lyase n=1 Tax=Paenibacillus eucommiae TaxID=1355755 RepID=A0ABS4IRJ8_9BACL|nr:putative enzyme related to lactoylglutathione lyase [Paenibacillus eucommiae]